MRQNNQGINEMSVDFKRKSIKNDKTFQQNATVMRDDGAGI